MAPRLAASARSSRHPHESQHRSSKEPMTTCERTPHFPGWATRPVLLGLLMTLLGVFTRADYQPSSFGIWSPASAIRALPDGVARVAKTPSTGERIGALVQRQYSGDGLAVARTKD